MKNEIKSQIEELKLKHNASILAHFYQEPDIQDIADNVADSLGMAYYGRDTSCDVLVVAGVLFMGETAKIISPEKTVLVPDLDAGCSLADNCPADEFKKFIDKYPNHTVVSYVNCSAEVKALSDILCTSSNAVKVIESIPKDKPIIFAPDKHLGSYLKKKTGRDLKLWDGVCIVHDTFETETIVRLKTRYPNAMILAHPECPEAVLDIADHIGSTSKLLEFTINNDTSEFIVTTESGIIHQMKIASPHKTFHATPNNTSCNCAECPFMRLNSLEKIRDSLLSLEPSISIPEEIRVKAVKPLERMLAIN